MTQMLPTVNEIKRQHVELLLPPNENDYENFCKVFQLAFDTSSEIIAQIVNRDLLWRPPLGNSANYYHWAGKDGSEAICALEDYLFYNRDSYWGESFDFTKEEKELRKKFYEHLRNTYTSADHYLDRVCEFFGKEIYLDKDLIQKKVMWVPVKVAETD